MILSGLEIEKNLNKSIVIEPFDRKALNPNSYNLKLHDELLIYKDSLLDMKKHNETKKIKIPEEGFVLEPGILYLGRTLEYTETHGFVPMLEGRSSVGRLGICIHVTAGFGDVGFKGYWTLEIHCIKPIKIYSFVEICQIYYHKIQGSFEPYVSKKYQNSLGIKASLLYKELEAGEECIN
jgi:dCTP deaminase